MIYQIKIKQNKWKNNKGLITQEEEQKKSSCRERAKCEAPLSLSPSLFVSRDGK
jgi:hypothetical protein